MLWRVVAGIVATTLGAGVASAQIFTRWDFNSDPPDPAVGFTTGSTTPAIDDATPGSTVQPLNTTPRFLVGVEADPQHAGGDNSAWGLGSFPAAGTRSGTAGAQFNVSTAGLSLGSPLEIDFYWAASPAASKYGQVQYTTQRDAATPTWTLLSPVAQTPGYNWQRVRVAIPAAATAARNAQGFAVRIVSVFAPGTSDYEPVSGTGYTTSGTWKFDLVTIHVPEPTAAGVVVAIGLGLRRPRCRRRGRDADAVAA